MGDHWSDASGKTNSEGVPTSSMTIPFQNQGELTKHNKASPHLDIVLEARGLPRQGTERQMIYSLHLIKLVLDYPNLGQSSWQTAFIKSSHQVT
jgi:hypothetical protein